MAENLSKRPKRGILKSSTSFEQREYSPVPPPECKGGAGGNMQPGHKHIPHFDESNIAATLHPPDKDYGFMKIDEPKTPYEYSREEDEEEEEEAGGGDAGQHTAPLNPNILAARIAMEVATGQKKQQHAGGGEEQDAQSGSKPSESESLPVEPAGSSGCRRSSGRRLSEPSADEADLALLSPEERDNRRKFEQKRKAHYNEFYALKMARQLMAEEEEDEEGETMTASQDSKSTKEELESMET